jgi:molybdopterin synthase catalytic subunit
MVEITVEPISPEVIVNRVKGDKSGGVVTYVGLIRESSRDKKVASVEYRDSDGKAASRLGEIANETNQKWQLNAIAICHRTGRLKVGDINLVVAIASAHRKEGFAACQYVIDRFKEKLPTDKRETYLDGSIWTEGK